MKTTLSKVLLTLLLGIFIASFASCGKCGGCDDIITTENATLRVNDSASIKLNGTIVLEILGVTSRKQGDRRCFYKDLIVCFNDDLSSDRLSVSCTMDLKLRKETILAGKNLMDLIVEDSIEYAPDWKGRGAFGIMLPLSNSFASGKYTFILGGTTKEGKPLRDTAIITY